jgi:hypothetical protein
VADLTDTGDKITVHLNFKKNLGNYQTMDFGAGVTVTQRDGESTEEVFKRAWRITEDQLDDAVDRATQILNES